MKIFEPTSYIPKIDPEQRERAEQILAIVSLKIEVEIGKLGVTSWILGEESVPAEFYKYVDFTYDIFCEETMNGSYLTVKSQFSHIEIEMLDGQLLRANSVKESDLEYWQDIEKSFTK